MPPNFWKETMFTFFERFREPSLRARRILLVNKKMSHPREGQDKGMVYINMVWLRYSMKLL